MEVLMKKKFWLCFLEILIAAGLPAVNDRYVKHIVTTTEVKPLSQLGEVNPEAIGKIKGQWIIEDSRFILEFSDHFACKLDGLKYYHYKRLNTSPDYPYIFTIVKSKESVNLYFARGYYKDGQLFGNTSRIEFKKNFLIVYSDKEPAKIYFRASRYVAQPTASAPSPKKAP